MYDVFIISACRVVEERAHHVPGGVGPRATPDAVAHRGEAIAPLEESVDLPRPHPRSRLVRLVDHLGAHQRRVGPKVELEVGDDTVVAFSGQGRGVCPSGGGRRMRAAALPRHAGAAVLLLLLEGGALAGGLASVLHWHGSCLL